MSNYNDANDVEEMEGIDYPSDPSSSPTKSSSSNTTPPRDSNASSSNVTARRRRKASSPDDTLAVGFNPSPMADFMADLWKETWTLAAASRVPVGRARTIKKDQLVTLIYSIYPLSKDGLREMPALEEVLVARARLLVYKHRKNDRFVADAPLGHERRDLERKLRKFGVVDEYEEKKG